MRIMIGKLDKDDLGRWVIVNRLGIRVEISCGQLIEVWSHTKKAWHLVTVIFDGRLYVAGDRTPMFIGQPARLSGPL